jgi:hypothetical protein
LHRPAESTPNAPPPGGGWTVEMVNNDATLSGSFRAAAVWDRSEL